MNKGITILFTCLVMVVLLATTSCKRRHICICKYYGPFDTTLTREYRGYSVSEANRLCKSEEHGSGEVFTIECSIR